MWFVAGGLGSIGLGGLGTLSGLTRQSTAVRTAAERAAEAAARIPDPPADTPRQKAKSVTFVEDGELACVRYFLKVSYRFGFDARASQIGTPITQTTIALDLACWEYVDADLWSSFA